MYCSDKCQRSDPAFNKKTADGARAFWANASAERKAEHKNASIDGLLEKYDCASLEEYKSHRSIEWLTIAKTFLLDTGIDATDFSEEEVKTAWGRHFGDILLNKTDAEKAATLDKRFETNLERYGSIGVLGDETIQAKYKATNLERRGVEYVMQDPAVFEKAYRKRCKKKDYAMPSGAVIRVQGYEPWALDKLVKQYSETDITVAEASFNISWIDAEGQSRVFFPDIYVKSEHRIIEVKSTYTWEKDEAINWQKKQACLEQGFDCQFWVFDGKGNLEVK
jgi:hypothetical protein